MKSKSWLWILLALSALGYYLIGHVLERSFFFGELAAFGACFLSYFIFCRYIRFQWWHLLVVGLLFRLLFIWGEPRLSDDYYRFIWDGKLMAEGKNPYAKVPADFSNGKGEIKEIFSETLSGMNSPDYYSVYPPLQQLFFLPAGMMDTIPVALLVLRLEILLGEILLFYFLLKGVQSQWLSFSVLPWIWLNPLWIVEVNGNLHFEGWMVTFLLMGIFLLQQSNRWAGAVSFGMAASLKLIPIMIIPLLKKWLGFKPSVLVGAGALFFFITTFLIFFDENSLANFSKSLDLYYHRFEFNGSLYPLVGWIGSWFTWTHPVVYASYILMGFFLAYYIRVYFKREMLEIQYFMKAAAIMLSAYYLLSTTVHPWYILPVLFLSVASGFSFGIVWSGLVFFSYSWYGASETVSLLFWCVEYVLLLLVILLEWKKRVQFIGTEG